MSDQTLTERAIQLCGIDLSKVNLAGSEDPTTKILALAKYIISESKCPTLRPILPLMFNLKGDPYSLKDHFPFEPFYRVRVPRDTTWIAGRQVSKSTSLASQGLIFSLCVPHFCTLFVTPLYEMCRRLSKNYVSKFIKESPVKHLMMDSSCVDSVLQKSFRNHSQLIFSFAFLDADRTRGVSADKVVFDEYQDMDPDFPPIISETMSHSQWAIMQKAGTPKTMENGLEASWQSSSMAEWMIKCRHASCGHWNIPALEYDLDDMIGDYHDDISEEIPAVVCAKCRKPVYPRDGRWVHRYKNKRWDRAGYHVPQIIMPLHYSNPEKWSILLSKRAGAANTPIHVFYNEVCGESYDSGAKIITKTDLEKAAILPWENDSEECLKHLGDYIYRIVAADWGGGGEDGLSYTTLAAMGMKPDGAIEVIWGYRSLTPHDHLREAENVVKALAKFKGSHLVHDYTGAGALRETFIAQAGFPYSRIIPVAYVRAARGNIMTFKPSTQNHPRSYYTVDKSRSLVLTCNQIKTGRLKFFKYDYQDSDNKGLLEDFLALTEDKSDSRFGSDIYTIIRNPQMTDDFAQAVNIGCCALWYMSKKWPNVAVTSKFQIPEEAMKAAMPAQTQDWSDTDLGFSGYFRY